MCGIAGFSIHSKSIQENREKIIKAMCDAIRHRGPDDEGYYITEEIALGQRRLSIIDLSGGHQPIFNEDKSISIIFNGEIYNYQKLADKLQKKGHQFRTNSDTEVIVHLYEEYGEECLPYLNGMFAFVIWDQNQKKIFAARDRIGQKPFFYSIQNHQFIFASEPKALLKHPEIQPKIDIEGMVQYLAYEYVPTPRSIYKGIQKLPAAHYLIYQNDSLQIQSYWHAKFSSSNLSLNEYEKNFEKLLLKAVERRLISDVPLGVFLSGGIDSSCLVAMMSQLIPSHQIKTFSIGFEEKSFDESTYAKDIAEHFQTDHHEKILSPQKMLEILPRITKILDEPLGDASIIPTYLLSEFTREKVTVALGGDGGDELLAGYPTFQAHIMANYYQKVPSFIRYIIKKIGYSLPVSTKNISFDFKVKRFLSGMDYNPYTRQQIWMGSFHDQDLPYLLSPEIQKQCRLENLYGPIQEHLQNALGSSLEKILYLYTKLYLQDDILTKVDRASMATSLEARAPFLDVDLVEFILKMPVSLKLKGLTTKYLLKKILAKKVPNHILNRPKKGFGIPVAKWLKDDLKPMILELFKEEKIREQGLFQYSYIKKMLQDHFCGKKDNRKQLWTLSVLQMWIEEYLQS